MDELEILIFVVSIIFAGIFLWDWYNRIHTALYMKKSRLQELIMDILPGISISIILLTLFFLASFDVKVSFLYILFYLAIGISWVYYGLRLMFRLFDLSWRDDVIARNNHAALYAVAGGILGTTIIYAGANIGDGPGWWCVFFAGFLGMSAWYILGIIVNFFTEVFERITVERDVYCGIRVGCYLLASGIMLGRASGGDWTSFNATIIEFTAGWPVLLLTILVIGVERYYIKKAKEYEIALARSSASYDDDYKFQIEKQPDVEEENYLVGSIVWGVIYVLLMVVSVMLLPSIL